MSYEKFINEVVEKIKIVFGKGGYSVNVNTIIKRIKINIR